MKKIFIPDGIYQKILDTLDEWKILDIRRLGELCGEISLPNLREKVRILERHGLAKSFCQNGGRKYVALKNYSPDNSYYDKQNPESGLQHDLIAGRVLREFLRWDCCLEGKISGEFGDGNRVYPDAEIIIDGGDKKIRAALEIEITRKSSWRVQRKFGKYSRENGFDLAVFITNKKGIFKSYKKYLMEMKEEVQQKIVIVLDEKLSMKSFDFKNSPCFFRGKIGNFSSILTS